MRKIITLFFGFFFIGFVHQVISMDESSKIEKNLSITDQVMYSIVRIQTEKGYVNSFRYDFEIEEEDKDKGIKVPCLVTNKSAVVDSNNAKLFFHEADHSCKIPTPLPGNPLIVDIKDFQDRWIGHPVSDLCIIPLIPIISAINSQYQKVPYMISLGKGILPSKNQDLSAVEDILTVGYLDELYDSFNNLPIFRKGITSSHPAMDFNGKSEFIIDVKYLSGSEGSPVFLYNNIGYVSGNSIRLGSSRVLLLGILYFGGKEFSNNFGCVIKSSQLEGFYPIIKKIINK